MDRREALHHDCYMYYTIEQIAAYYQVSKATVRTWIKANEIPFSKLGGVDHFKLADIEALAFNRRNNDQAPNGEPE